MVIPEKWPRLLREPTGWLVLVGIALFVYLQWPTRVKQPEQIRYQSQTYAERVQVAWEDTPVLYREGNPEVWTLERRSMSFMVQISELTTDFTSFVEALAEQDRAQVGGVEETPLEITEYQAEYAWYDAEGRIQRHVVFRVDDQWVKVSALYKPSLPERVDRAAAFFDRLALKDPVAE